MDRQWMYVGDRREDPYMTGLRSFLEVAKANTKDGFISCPCFDCENTKSYSTSKIIHMHLLRRGFMPSYNCWTKHGEIGVMMEDNDEEEDDDNYPMFPKYDDAARGKLKMKRHQMISPC